MSPWRATRTRESIVLFLIYGALFLLIMVAANYLFTIDTITNSIITNIGICAISFKFLYPITRGNFKAQPPRDAD